MRGGVTVDFLLALLLQESVSAGFQTGGFRLIVSMVPFKFRRVAALCANPFLSAETVAETRRKGRIDTFCELTSTMAVLSAVLLERAGQAALDTSQCAFTCAITGEPLGEPLGVTVLKLGVVVMSVRIVFLVIVHKLTGWLIERHGLASTPLGWQSVWEVLAEAQPVGTKGLAAALAITGTAIGIWGATWWRVQ